MKTFGMILQIVLAVYIGLGGFIKILQLNFQVEHWKLYQYPMWFMTITGILELIALVALIWGLWNQNLSIIGSLLILVLMIGAIYTHIFRVEQPLTMAIPASICFILAIFVMVRNI